MIRLIHTGDVHMGRAFKLLGPFGRTVRAQIRETFGRVLTLARQTGADAVLVCGDLFDSTRPDVSDVRVVLDEVRKLDPTPVLILPGTHDCLGEDSIYARLRERPRNLHLFLENEVQTILLGRIGLAIHGRACSGPGGPSPLRGVRPHPEARFNVAMAHASIPLPQIVAGPTNECFVSEADMRSAGVQYCALGHWHKRAEYFPGNPCRTWYCGSPETVQFEDGEGSGYALEVLLDEGRVEVTPHLVGKYRWTDRTLDVTTFGGTDQVRRVVERLAGPEAIVRVGLAGTVEAESAFDTGAMQKDLSPQFAWLRIEGRGLKGRWTEFDPGTLFPAGTVGSTFVALAKGRLEVAPEGEKGFWEEVLRRGVALLAEREDVSG